MNKTRLIMACGMLLAGVALFAQENESAEAELKKDASSKSVQADLEKEPDGVSIFIKGNDSFQILARGTGTYDFDDPDDIKDARKEAELNAKSALAKFFKEKVSTSEGIENVSTKIRKLSSDGEVETQKVSKESVKVIAEKIVTNADAILKGVITLKEVKEPNKGKNSGQIQVTIGVSNKTLDAVTKLVKATDAVPDQGTTKSKPSSGAGKASGTGKIIDGSNNKPEVREAKTDF